MCCPAVFHGVVSSLSYRRPTPLAEQKTLRAWQKTLRIKRVRQKPLVRQSRTATIAATATVITIAVAAIATTTMTTISAIIEPAPIAATTAAYAAIISISTRRYISSKRELIA